MIAGYSARLVLAGALFVSLVLLYAPIPALLLVLLVVGLVGLTRVRARRRVDQRRRHEGELVRDYVERHSFPDDSVEDFVTDHGEVTLGEARRRLDAWRSGYLAAERDARERRARAAKGRRPH